MDREGAAKNFRPDSNISASMDYFHPEVQEIQPLKTLTNVNTDAVVIAIALLVLSYR